MFNLFIHSFYKYVLSIYSSARPCWESDWSKNFEEVSEHVVQRFVVDLLDSFKLSHPISSTQIGLALKIVKMNVLRNVMSEGKPE